MNARELTNLACGVYGAMQKPEEFMKLMEFCLERPHETILEIGSGRGGTLWAWSHLPNNKTVISVDLPGGAFGGGLSEDDRERIENWVDKEKNTFLCAMDSHDKNTRKEVIDTLNQYGDGFVDILYIDGDHTYEGVKQDYEMYSPLVRPGGIIILHDICEHPPETECEVKKFWDELMYKIPKEISRIGPTTIHKRCYEEFISEPINWGGIGVLEIEK